MSGGSGGGENNGRQREREKGSSFIFFFKLSFTLLLSQFQGHFLKHSFQLITSGIFCQKKEKKGDLRDGKFRGFRKRKGNHARSLSVFSQSHGII